MMTLPSRVRVFVSLQPTDMRKQMNGLETLVREGLGRHPRSGEMFVFRSKRGDMARVLFFDQQGFCLLSKRMEKGTFQLPSGCGESVSAEISPQQLGLLLSGKNPSQL